MLMVKKKEDGELKEAWEFEKPKSIPDPKAKKPSDWVDNEEMDDPSDVKPSDWDDEPEKITDADAKKPEDWDDEEDGEWEAPLIDNPNYKGEWKANRIKNPAYKGAWIHPQVPNPDYVEHKDVYKRGSIGYVGIEVWQVKAGTVFSDFILTDDVAEAEKFSKERPVDHSDEEKVKKTFDDANKGSEEEEKPTGDFEDETHDEL